MHVLTCLISGAPRKPRFSQATLKNGRESLFQHAITVAQLVVSFIAGFLFAVGLIVSGMSNPSKVLNFLDVTGNWDPTLAFVMAGALLVTFPAFHFVLRRSAPLLSDRFYLPTRQQIDAPLVSGAAIFGVGWGLAGLCPGPALTALGSGATSAFVFVAAMTAGALVHKYIVQPRLNPPRATAGLRP